MQSGAGRIKSGYKDITAQTLLLWVDNLQLKIGGDGMASNREYLKFILEQLSGLEDVSSRPMMGEFMLYYRGKLIGGIYDNRFLVKNVSSARVYMPEAALEAPYDGANKMLLVDNVDDREYLEGLFKAMYDELPLPKPRRRKSNG